MGNEAKPGPVDMSPAAIEKRLREVSELYRLYQKLRKARRIGPVEPSDESRHIWDMKDKS